jgi:hypothetical protein
MKKQKGKIFSECHKGKWGNGGTAPCILNLCTRFRPWERPLTHI